MLISCDSRGVVEKVRHSDREASTTLCERMRIMTLNALDILSDCFCSLEFRTLPEPIRLYR